MASTQKKGNSRKKRLPRRPRRRITPRRVWPAASSALLALCVLVSYFNVDALLLVWIARVLKGALGYGYYLTAPVLAAMPSSSWSSGTTCRPAYHLRGAAAPAGGRAVPPGPVPYSLHPRPGQRQDPLEPTDRPSSAAVCSPAVWPWAARPWSARWCPSSCSWWCCWPPCWVPLHLTPQEAAQRVRSYGESLRRDDEDADDEALPEGFTPPLLPPRQKKPAKGRRRPNIDIPLDSERDDTVLPPASSFFPPPQRRYPHAGSGAAGRSRPCAPAPQRRTRTARRSGGAPPRRSPSATSRKKAQLQQEVESAAQEVSDAIEQELAQGEETYRYPPITLLEQNRGGNYTEVGAELRNNSKRLADTLRSFGVDARAGEVIHGPSVTRYEFTLDQGVKLSKITNLQDDIALALGASGVRIAPVPNKISAVGIEVPNRTVTAVRIRDVIESREFIDHPSPVAFAVGRDIGGSNIVGNIARLPHVLIAGTTGSGKSVCTNSLIVSLLYKSTPDEVRFIMVDPKMVELAPYNGIPHLLIPVVTDPKKAAGALQWAVFEMMKRYKMFSEKGVKDLAGYNALSETDEDVKSCPPWWWSSTSWPT